MLSKSILKFMEEGDWCRIVRIILKRSKVRGLIGFDFKSYHKGTVIKMAVSKSRTRQLPERYSVVQGRTT